MSARIFSPATAASALLHILVLVAMLVSWPWAKEIRIGAAVPVNIVANAPATNLRPAVEAPEAQTAQTEVPALDAPEETVTPQPEPSPAPPTAAAPPPPAPAPKAARPAPTAKSKPAEKPSDMDFDALLASINKSGKTSGAERARAEKGRSRAETAPQGRPDLGSGLSASALAGLADELQRRWNPNCEVEGGQDVQIRTTFTLGPTGQVIGEVRSEIRAGGAGGVAQAAAERATRAVYAAAPFRNLPRELYGQRIAVNFNAREACS
ncbi:MAG: energy transducer TonB [Phenylobacterium sp.]|uniref:energy transducer TonB n=1 Tax=Phenylobacterium sp. TaxID=1871053 RepID=UPI00391DECCB